jgi:pimeloyl-ACP methyl ester carboxylesterase
MAPDKLVPNDSRVKQETAQIRGKTYKYIVGEPEGTPLETMVLIHGFPDLGFGWRYQVPHFMSLGFRVIVPDTEALTLPSPSRSTHTRASQQTSTSWLESMSARRARSFLEATTGVA